MSKSIHPFGMSPARDTRNPISGDSRTWVRAYTPSVCPQPVTPVTPLVVILNFEHDVAFANFVPGLEVDRFHLLSERIDKVNNSPNWCISHETEVGGFGYVGFRHKRVTQVATICGKGI